MRLPQDIHDKLWNRAKKTAANYGYKFAPDCDTEFKNFISTGVNEIDSKGYLDDEIRIALAYTNIIAFTIWMVVEAQKGGIRYDLDKAIFFSVKEFICPLWPFC